MSRRPNEILVHIGAPSRASDDKRYRTLAGAYLDFEPTRRIPISKTQEHSGEGLKARGGPVEGVKTPKHQRVHPPHLFSSSQPGRDGESFELNSPQLSFRSVENNLDSPRLRRVPEQSQESQESWQAPPSEIPDSHPESNRPLETFCSPTRLLEHFLSGLDSSQSDHSPLAYRRVDEQRLTFHSSQATNEFSDRASSQEWEQEPRHGLPGGASPHSDTGVGYPATEALDDGNQRLPEPVLVQTIQVPSSLPVQPTSSNNVQRSEMVIPQSPVMNIKRARLFPPTPAGGDISHITSSYPSQKDGNLQPDAITSSPRADSEPPPPKRLRRSHQDPDPGRPLPRSSSDVGPRQVQGKEKADQRTVRFKRSTEIPGTLEISSPLPPVGEGNLVPEDMITEALGKLANSLDLSKRFSPESQIREIRPFERGYWLVDCRTWEDELKLSCWGFLADYLHKGLAGWGTRCDRNPEFSEMRLWCFGHLVGHIYLLLYLASKRQIRYASLSWISGDGKAVIAIGAKPAPA